MCREETEGVHAFWHENIFEAVYCTNLLMRSCDVLLTKPSELAFYPVPKLFIRRIGGHEQWGAIHSAEIGDGCLECRDIPHTLQMLDLFLYDEQYLEDMCENIVANKKAGIYDGAYKGRADRHEPEENEAEDEGKQEEMTVKLGGRKEKGVLWSGGSGERTWSICFPPAMSCIIFRMSAA